jgi:hypothetical protein
MPTRMLSVLGVAVVAAVIGGAFALTASTSPSPFRTIRNQGRPVDPTSVPAKERALLVENNYSPEVSYLGGRGQTRFYLGKSSVAGVRCYITGGALRAAPHFGVLGCPAPSTFPTEDQPVLDYSTYSQDMNDPYPTIDRLAGFAADGIAAVGIRGPSGDTTWVPVAENIYGGGSFGPVAVLLARDADGNVVYSHVVGDGKTLAEKYGR